MGPPQVNLNEKPPADQSQDPLPEKKDSAPVVVTVDRNRPLRCAITAEQRRQRKRCRIACCASLSFILVLLLALGTACLVYRMNHRKGWRSFCGTQEGDRIPEHVNVDHDNKLISVQPDHHNPKSMEVLHEYNRGMIAFKNSTSNTCYIDRLDETFSEGYARWQGYEETAHVMNRTLRVVPQPIQIEVVEHFAGVHIVEHCGGTRIEYFWVMEVKETEITPADKYIRV